MPREGGAGPGRRCRHTGGGSDLEPVAEPDLRIASIALAHDLTLVTGNARHFSRVPGLNVENWMAA